MSNLKRLHTHIKGCIVFFLLLAFSTFNVMVRVEKASEMLDRGPPHDYGMFIDVFVSFVFLAASLMVFRVGISVWFAPELDERYEARAAKYK